MNFAQRVRAIAAWAPERTAIEAAELRLSYGGLEAMVARAATDFAALGVRPGDRVALLLPNVAEFAIAYLAALRVGGIATSISVTWRAVAVRAALATCTPRVVVTTEALAALIDDAPGSDRATIVIDAPSPTAWLARLATLPAMEHMAPRLPHDAAAILYSSGTTGAPKGVTLSHGNVRFNAGAKRVHLALTATDRVVCFVPLTHVFGQNAVLTAALSAGATVMLQPRFDEASLVEAVERGATVMMGAPPAFGRLLRAGLGARLRGLRVALSAAAPLDERIALEWKQETGRAMHVGYGLTECSPFAAHDHHCEGRPGDVGRAVVGVMMRTCDPETGRVLPPGEAGEIEVAGPNVMLGYWQDTEATQAVRRGDWLRTGDLGYSDATGRFHVVDRLADVVNVSGFKAIPADVERALRLHPGVREAAAFAAPDERSGQRVEAAIVCGAPGLDDAALAALCAEHLPAWAVPRRFHRVEALPLSPNGKVQRRALASLLGTSLADSLAAGSPDMAPGSPPPLRSPQS